METEFVVILSRQLVMFRVTMNLLISVMFTCLCEFIARPRFVSSQL